jgi:Flp pilus assembly protein TadG
VLCLLVLATAELGRAFIQYTILSHGVRQAARYLTEHSISGTTGVVAISSTEATRTRNLAVYGNIGGTGARRLPGFQPNQVAPASVGNSNVRVIATYPYQPLVGATLPTFGLGAPISLTFNMQIAITMRAIS